ncbi:MAG TPA: endolytic transglycosylase MltG [Candidatus Limnocylindrales bacterium]|nr:endolytic transglycosylase MltG [Candidatus Limnocylindrales bacterium]
MTIRSGGRPRDQRPIRRYDPDAYATEYVPEGYEPSRRYGYEARSRRRGRGGSGIFGLFKFLIFALLLAALVLIVALTALRPVVNSAILGWAQDSPGALKFPFVADIVREDLGQALTQPVSTDPAQVEFLVEDGDTASTIATRLGERNLIRDPRAFIFIASERELTGALQQGTFVLRKNMTPEQLVSALLAPPPNPFIEVDLRTGLRLEQITAKLQTLDGLDMDPREFYELAKEPPEALLSDYPWLQRVLEDAPEDASLEGFLWPGNYRVLPDTTPDELIRKMLDAFHDAVGDAKMKVPAERKMTFYQVLTLASLVEREARLDEEKALIAGVYQNRLNGLPGVRNRILNADPTVIWANDTVQLDALDFDKWREYRFWTVPKGVGLRNVELPESLLGYQTYIQPGLFPGPIATPTVASIDAAIRPDTADKFLYFLAIPDDSGKHVFAKTAKQHEANRKKYGYT